MLKRQTKVSGFISGLIVSFLILLYVIGILNAPGVLATPAGFQEFYIPLPADVVKQIFADIDNDPTVSNNMHCVIGVTASQDNTTVYYDHWENGLLTGAAGDEVVTLNKGDVHYFESSNIPTNPRGSRTYYDGKDRIFVAGSLLQLVVSVWPEVPGTIFTDAWEVYPVQAWEREYTIPVGEDLSVTPTQYLDFSKVYVLVMSGTDNNSVQINDPLRSAPVSYTLNRGETVSLYHIGSGTKVTASDPVEVQFMTGRPRAGSASEMRGYTATPRAYWGTSYYAPVPSWSEANSNLFLYNPNSFNITINFTDLTGAGSFALPAGKTKSYRDGAGRYVPIGSGVYLESDNVFWGIASADTGSYNWDWGYALIPTGFLTADNYVSWAPGTANRPPTANGSPVYVTAVNDNTTIFVDYSPNDGTFDAVYTLDRLEVIQIYDPDNDNTGMHIVSTAPVAIAWGESPDTAAVGTPYLDMGYTTLPLPTEWLDVALQVEKTVNPTEVNVGEEAEFTIIISAPGAAEMTGIDLEDTLPPGWEYITGSGDPSDPTSIAGDLSSGYMLTWNADWNISPGSSQTVRYCAQATSAADTVNPNRNVATATGQTLGATLTADDDAFVNVEPAPLPTIAFSPSSLIFSATEGGANPPGQTLSIWNSGGGILNWSVSDNATWLTLSPTSGSSTGEMDNVAVSVDISGMKPGSYGATITISAEGATNTPQTVPVSLTINPAPNPPNPTKPTTSVPVFPSIYTLIVAVVATGGLGYILRNKLTKQT
jgi:uncharacterized repeat protein (TIGR01451 family)